MADQRRYGLRSMLSSLIWGAPKDGDESESGDESQGVQLSDNEDDDAGHGAEVHEISDDDEEEPEKQEKGFQRYSSAQKGKGRAEDVFKSARQSIQTSRTFGDLRASKRSTYDDDDTPTSTPAQSPTKASAHAGQKRQRSPPSINSELANFFAQKGVAPLSADERRHVADLLQRGSASAAQADLGNVPTAYTPAFTFASPLPRKSTSASVCRHSLHLSLY